MTSVSCPTDFACDPGELCCAGMCADTFVDEYNCGDCGVVCGAGSACLAGSCVPSEKRLCQDGLDNDGDADADCSDSECAMHPACP